jgi:hypothetical protein
MSGTWGKGMQQEYNRARGHYCRKGERKGNKGGEASFSMSDRVNRDNGVSENLDRRKDRL